jgi:hypothetical protein
MLARSISHTYRSVWVGADKTGVGNGIPLTIKTR